MQGFKQYFESLPGVANAINPIPKIRPVIPNYRTQQYQNSIVRGKESETDIAKGLETSCGWTLAATDNELQDMRLAIDTFLIDNKGNKIPVQIKARKFQSDPRAASNNDIGYEVAKDFNAKDEKTPPPAEVLLNDLNGRDMRGIAKLTVVLDQSGTKIYIIDTNEGHGMIKDAVTKWAELLNRFSNYPLIKKQYQMSYMYSGISLLYKFDTRDYYWKIMAYINPSKFKSLQVCYLNKKINNKFDY